MEAVTVALIMSAGTIITQLVIAAVNKRTTTEIINYKIGNLEKEVKKHNSLVERMYKVEQCAELHNQRITCLEDKD